MKDRFAKLKKIRNGLDEYIDILSDHRLGAYAAQSAFFMVMSIFPFLMLMLSIVHYLPVSEEQIVDIADSLLPDVILQMLLPIIREVFESHVSILTFSILTVIWSSSKGFRSTCNGLDSVNGVLKSRSYWITYVKGIIYAVSLALMLVISLAIMVLGPQIQHLLEIYVPPLAVVTAVLIRFRAVILLVVMGLVFTLIYMLMPQKKLSFRSQMPGGFTCAIGWVVFSYLLSLYVDWFNGFSMYGSLTGAVLFMFWMYACHYIMLMCAEINVFLEDNSNRLKLKRVSSSIFGESRRTVRKHKEE